MLDNIILFIAIATRCVAAIACWYCIGVGMVLTTRTVVRYVRRHLVAVLG